MLLAKSLEKNLFLPVLIVILILSIESISVAILEFILVSIKVADVNFLSYSDEFLNLMILTLAKGLGIVVLILIFRKRLRIDEPKKLSKIKYKTFLIATILIFVGCIGFLMRNLQTSLFIISDTAEFIEVWPKIILSKITLGYMGYQLFIILLFLVITPIFEELLFRKAVVQALLKKGFGTGWILVISSIIYAISPVLVSLIDYSEGQTFWDLTIRFISGIFLGMVFLKTKKIRYPILLKFLLNSTIYIYFLTMFHPSISTFMDYILILQAILDYLGIFLFFYVIIDGIATLWTNSSPPQWLDPLLDFRVSKEWKLKPLIYSILILLPLVPFGIVLFVDHTILYNDFGGSLVETVITIILLGLAIFVCGIMITSYYSLFEAYSKPNIPFTTILRDIYQKIRKFPHEMIKENPKALVRHIGVIILILGAISPVILIAMDATVFTTIVLFIRGQTEMEMISGQNPFMSFTRVSIITRSDVLWMIPPQGTTEEMFYILKHTNGQWYFLPDTFMSGPGDWLNGLMTVGTWFLFLILLFYAVYEYYKNRRILAGLLVIGVIGTEILWYLLTFGIGSTSGGGGPPTPSTNQTLSQFIQMDFEMNSFILLPLGLIILILAAVLFLFSGIWHHRKEKSDTSRTNLNNNNVEQQIK